MAHIKSALELALEKTEGIKINKDEIRLKEIQNKGRTAASEFLFGNKTTAEELSEAVGKYRKKEKEAFREGIIKTFLSNITLPKNGNFTELADKITEGLSVLTKDKKQVGVFMEQLKSFFSKYMENREDLTEAAKAQYQPRLRQKEQELARQTGQQVQLTPEQDPEFMEFLKQNLARLDEQYSMSLKQFKDELKRFIG